MPISRFEKFKPVDFQQVPIYTPDFELLDQTMGQVQSEYDQGRAKIEEATFKNLGADKMTAKELRDAQNQMTDDISAQYREGIGKGRRAMAQGLVDLSRDYKEGGQRYQINKNYESFMAQREELKKRIGKPGGITQAQMSAWENYTLNNYNKQGGAAADDFGMYAGIPMDDVAAYVDGNKRAEEIAKNWKANKVSTGQWSQSNGKYYKKTKTGTTEVSYDEVMQGTLNALRSDPELINYLENFATHEGREIDLTDMGYQNKDKSFTYNMNNPLVRYANTPARKWSYRETEYDQDLKIDSYRLEDYKQGLKEKAENRQHNFLTHSSLAGGWQKETAANLDVTNSDIEKIENSIAAAEKDVALAKGNARAQAKGKAYIARQKAILANKKKNRDAALARVAPKYAEADKEATARKNAAGISTSQHNTYLEQALKYTISSGGYGGKYAGQSGVKTQEAVTDFNYQSVLENRNGLVTKYAEAAGIDESEAQKILMKQTTVDTYKRDADKGYQAALREQEEQNAVAVPWISLNTNEKEKGYSTVAGAASKHLVDTPESYIWMTDDGSVVQGTDIKQVLADQYSDGDKAKIKWSKGRATNLVLNDTELIGSEELKGDQQVRFTAYYTDANGNDVPINLTAGAIDGVSDHVVKQLGDDIIANSSSSANAIAIINHRNREKDLDQAFSLYENNRSQQVTVGAARQMGQDPNYDFKEITVTPDGQGVATGHTVSFGGVNFKEGDFAEAKETVKSIKYLTQLVSKSETVDDAMKLVRGTIGFDNRLTEENAKTIISFLKK